MHHFQSPGLDLASEDKSCQKLSGKVGQVTDTTVHITTLTGQEFYEAAIVLNDVSAIVVRAAPKQ